MTDKCLARSDAPYISYCMACRDRFARQGRESRHILELVYGIDAGAPPDISEKRYNRLSLKNELLRESAIGCFAKPFLPAIEKKNYTFSYF